MARPVVTLGASIARDRVDAVALCGGNAKLTDRVLAHRVAELATAMSAGLPEVIESLLDGLAAEIDTAEYEIGGAAVTYRDPAGRRAVVTGLAGGPWYEASLVSAKSAHLALARAMTWTKEFDHLLVCELMPGYQGFSLISPHRDRVVAAVSTTAGLVSEDSLRPGIAAAWDQFDAAGVWPSAVVVIGTGVRRSAVSAALSVGFNTPVIPGAVGAAGSAIGAALVAQPEMFVTLPAERVRVSRNSVAIAAAASVLAGGVAIGGIHELTDHPRSDATTRLADASTTGPVRGPRHARPEPSLPAADSIPEMPQESPFEHRAPRHAKPDTDLSETSATPASSAWGGSGGRSWPGVLGPDSEQAPKELVKQQPEPQSQRDHRDDSVPPAPTDPVGAPDGSLLFPGEPAPPPLGTPEFNRWWDHHVQLTVRWVETMMAPHDPVTPPHDPATQQV